MGDNGGHDHRSNVIWRLLMTGLSLKTPQPKSCYGRDSSAIVALDVGQQIKAQLAGLVCPKLFFCKQLSLVVNK